MDPPSTPRCLIRGLPDEILEQILLDDLDQSSLNAVVRTCHRLYEVGIRILWRHISYGATYKDRTQYYNFRHEIDRDSRKGELVRSLRADSSKTFTVVGKYGTLIC